MITLKTQHMTLNIKKDLIDLTIQKIVPIQKEITKLMSDHQYLDSIMIEGRDKASIIADSVLSKVYKIIGLNKL